MIAPFTIARLRIRAAQLQCDEAWHTITYSVSHIVRCSCGGGVRDLPGTGEYDGGGCSHIVALYAGALTEGRCSSPPRTGLGRPQQPYLGRPRPALVRRGHQDRPRPI